MALVYGIAQLLGGGAGDPTGASARPVGAAAGSTTAPSPTGQAAPGAVATTRAGHGSGRHQATPTPTPLAVPTGPCQDRDVTVTPTVRGTAYAGSAVTFDLELATKESPACTWTVSPRSVVVKLTSGSDRIWSTQDCKAVVGKQDVVVRKDVATKVSVTWRGQRSDGSCSRTTAWAQPGFYHATAASIGGEPAELQFELHEPPTTTITPSPTAKPHPKNAGKGNGGGEPKKPGQKKTD